jgi:hypothetical protein
MSDSRNATVEQRLKQLEDAVDRLKSICEASSRVSEQYEQSPEIRVLDEKAALMEVLYEEGKKNINPRTKKVDIIKFMEECKKEVIEPEIVIEHMNSKAEKLTNSKEKVQTQREIKQFAEKVRQARILQVARYYDLGQRTYMDIKELCEKYKLTVSEIETYFQDALSNLSGAKAGETHLRYSTILDRFRKGQNNPP